MWDIPAPYVDELDNYRQTSEKLSKTNIRRKWNYLYVDKYKMRWGIETVFRVLDRIDIKTTTKNEIYRYFLHIFCCLLYNLWKCAVQFGCTLSLKNFAAKLAKFFDDILQEQLLLDPG